MPLLKSITGIPDPLFPVPEGVVLADEARTARRRFYPVTILFTAYSTTVLALALVFHPGYALAYLALGVMAWTLLEYLVHRFILHGRFPEGRGSSSIARTPSSTRCTQTIISARGTGCT